MTTASRKMCQIMEPRYKVYYRDSKCYYCGDVADTMDHVPPISIAYASGADLLESRGIKLIKVSSCRNCNVLLGDSAIMTLPRRITYLYSRIQEKYAKFLKTGDFDLDEADDFGPILKSYVSAHLDVRTWLNRRLEFMEDMHYDIV